MKKIVATILVLVLLIAGFVIIKKKKEEITSLPTPTVQIISIETALPKTMKIIQTRSFIARYYSAKHPKIASKVSGFIDKIYVSEGQNIKKDELLAKIDDREVQSQIQAQKAAIKSLEHTIKSIKATIASLRSDFIYAKNVYERNLALFRADALPKEKLELSKVAMELKKAKLQSTKETLLAKNAELQTQKATLQAKEALLSYTTIKSPIDGIVGTVFLKKGDLVMPGKPILELLSHKKYLEFTFPNTLDIQKGMQVLVQNQKFPISKILPNAQKYLAVARVELPSLNLAENSQIKVELIQKEAKGVAVPVNALVEKNGKIYIFEKQNSGFKAKEVKVIAQNASYAILTPAPSKPVAIGSNDKLSKLFFIKEVHTYEK